jgi:uncharacterized paraquat-inducible protein A
MVNVSGLVILILLGSILLFRAHGFWLWFKYLRWKWKAISYYEREDRRRKGLCVKCGYDLRASKVRCPECGTPFESKIVPPAKSEI